MDHLARIYEEHVRQLEARYAEALSAAGFDAVLVHSGTPQKKTSFDDQSWPLRPTPELQHWAPLAEPSCSLLVNPGHKTRLSWPETKDFWERPGPPEATHFLNALHVRRTDAVELPAGKRIAFVGDDAARAEALGLRDVNPPALMKELERLRTTKSPYEIACIAEANRRAALGHEAVRRAFADGHASELDLHLLYLRATHQDDPETPYKNIVAQGANAAILHHVSYGRERGRAESLLLDAGATCLGYCSDITRTWIKPADAAGQTFAALVAAMEAMQQRICAAIAVGKPYEELHDESHRQLSAILVEAGLAKGSPEEIDDNGVSRVFCPHGLGHSLGLQTHDVGCAVVKPRPANPFLRNTSRIAEGQVFTIEPGLYFIDRLLAELKARPEGKLVDWSLVEALTPLGGIRVEDDVLVTAAQHRNITRELLPLGGGVC